MRPIFSLVLAMILAGGAACAPETAAKPEQPVRPVRVAKPPADMNPDHEAAPDHKLVIYQMMTRLFGNKGTANKLWGTIEENGVGKFADITDTALKGIKELGVTHVYYTGIISHAIASDYTKFGIPLDDVDVIKGRAGSPFAIKDYYDVNPDMAVDVRKRMAEFEALIARTHKNGMKVVIDFVPNHVGREYKSLAKPAGVKDFGETDDTSKAFAPMNNYYYIPGQPFKVPTGYQALGKDGAHPTKDGKFDENPAKVTGNDVFSAAPSVNDWFETIKLNYGVDIKGGRRKHFDPIPDTWIKMRDILLFWAAKGVDGVRCDMVEMVPVEFWGWVTPLVKAKFPNFIFIAEIYNPSIYKEYIVKGGFDYLYDKVGLYDVLRGVVTGGREATSIYFSWRGLGTTGPEDMKKGIAPRMLRFLENHDEQRFASRFFAGDPWAAVPAMTVSTTLSSGPVMIYYGQEVGEPAAGMMGFSGDDGRTTIFDFWGVPEHQKWMNGGKFDGGGLSEDQKKLREFYRVLLAKVAAAPAIRSGQLYDVHFANSAKQSEGYVEKTTYAYLRYLPGQTLLVVVNFNRKQPVTARVKIPARFWELAKLDPARRYRGKDLLSGAELAPFTGTEVTDRTKPEVGVPVTLPPNSAFVYELSAE